MTVIGRIADHLERVPRDFVYDILPVLASPLRLAVDVGAAAGEHTQRLAGLAKGGQVVAFEPFPGNHGFFRDATKGMDHVRLVPKAVSDKVSDKASFLVPSVVEGTEVGWEDRAGYSSVGYLPPTERALDPVRLKHYVRSALARLKGASPPRRVEVATTTLDAEFPEGVIDFLKVDVQGAEPQVLAGARALLSQHRIALLYVEWSDDETGRGMPDILAGHGYSVYDSLYVASPARGGREGYEELGFRDIQEIRLSTGRVAYEMTLAEGEPRDAMVRARRAMGGWIQTDLLAVRPETHDVFLRSLRDIRAAQGPGR